MNIAILGATSLIARDLVSRILNEGNHQLRLFSRDTSTIQQLFATQGIDRRFSLHHYAEFADDKYDAIINFVGAGDPLQIQALASSILDITFQFDEMVLRYLTSHADCKYIFLSSGAAYGSKFEKPATENTCATIELNNPSGQDWYGIAKLYSECRHRALNNMHITDIRVFNYISRTQNLSARFLITDMLRAIRDGEVFRTGADDLVRDYLHPDDFHALIGAVLTSKASNSAVDCYSKAPVSKNMLLQALSEKFGLRYEITMTKQGILATGNKLNYYSVNHKASEFAYAAKFTSLEGVLQEAAAILENQ